MPEETNPVKAKAGGALTGGADDRWSHKSENGSKGQ
jgi:hypothetical protein